MNTVKYAAFNRNNNDIYLCNSKASLAKHINTSVDTIRRREHSDSVFIINDWVIHTDVKIVKQPARNSFK